MVITSGAYIKGAWSEPFDLNETKRLSFQFAPGQSFVTNMMQKTSVYFLSHEESCDLIEIPCAQKEGEPRLVMTILLPKKGISLNELQKNFTWQQWNLWKNKTEEALATLTLPRFRMEKRLDLISLLESLELVAPFTAEADFSSMTEKPGFYINKFIHKTSIQMDEKGFGNPMIPSKRGTKEIEKTNNEASPYEFLVDHPFIFIIWEQKTGAILWMGHVINP